MFSFVYMEILLLYKLNYIDINSLVALPNAVSVHLIKTIFTLSLTV